MAKLGRPLKDQGNPRSKPTSIRLTEGLTNRLHEAARRDGRQLSDEIVRRLEASFAEHERLIQIFGGENSLHFFTLCAQSFKYLREHLGECWHRDPFTFEEAGKAIAEVLYYFRPSGRRVVPKRPPLLNPESGQIAGPPIDPAKFPFGEYAGRLAVLNLLTASQISGEPQAPRPAAAIPPAIYQRLTRTLGPLMSKAGRRWPESPFASEWRSLTRSRKHKGGK
jgi:hypothetical protein